MLEELVQGLKLDNSVNGTVTCCAFEDNQGALLLANNHRLSPRTRHFNVKYHWFWENVDNEDLSVQSCGTREQRADGFTKCLVRELFELNRKVNQGW
jgi:hypothetical protein